MFCIECGQQLSEDSLFCGSCGATVTDATSDVFCIECGAKQPDDAEFCIECGTKVVTESHEQNEEPVAPKPVITEEPVLTEPELVEPPPVHLATPSAAQSSSSGMVKLLAITTIVLLVAVIGLIVYMFVIQGDSYQEGTGPAHQTHDQQMPPGIYMPADEYHIQRVRNGHLHNHPDVAIGFALERYFDQIEWRHSYVPEENLNRVFVHGYMPADGTEPDGTRAMGQFVFQFAVDGSFRPIQFVLNGNFEDVRLMYEMLDMIMDMSR